jgi:hypothetical protein
VVLAVVVDVAVVVGVVTAVAVVVDGVLTVVVVTGGGVDATVTVVEPPWVLPVAAVLPAPEGRPEAVATWPDPSSSRPPLVVVVGAPEVVVP